MVVINLELNVWSTLLYAERIELVVHDNHGPSHLNSRSVTLQISKSVGHWSLNQLGHGLYKPRTECMEHSAVRREDRAGCA